METAVDRKYVKAEDFVPVYRQCTTDEEVAEKLGMKLANVKSTASRLRGKGVKLPKRARKPGGNALDIEALNAGYELPESQA